MFLLLALALLSTLSYADELTIDWNGQFGNDGSKDLGTSVGDTVKFTWKGYHNVFKMASKAAYDSCDFKGATNLGSASPVTEHLTEAGVTYYACQIGSHCGAQQKIMITATAAPTCEACVAAGKNWAFGDCIDDCNMLADAPCYEDAQGCEAYNESERASKLCQAAKDCESCQKAHENCLFELSGGSCFEGSDYWGPQDGVVSNGGTCPNVASAWCENSPAQICRMGCPEQSCPSGQCAMREDTCCKYKCQDRRQSPKPTGRFNLKNLGKTRPDTTNLVSKVEGKQGVEKGNVVVKLVKTVRSKITSNLDKAGLKSNLQAAFPKSTVTVAESAKRRRLANEYDVTIATDVTNKADEPEITTAVLTSLDGVDAASEPEVQYKAEVEAGLQEGTSKDDLQSIADDAARDLGATAGEVNVTEPTDDGSEDDDGKTSASALAALMVGVLGVLML
jgi:hypothetical protein